MILCMGERRLAFSLSIAFIFLGSPCTAQVGRSGYIPGRLGNRPIFWCPSGYGYGAYCPQPTDSPSHTWCCLWPSDGILRVSCCPFALPVGMIIGLILSCIIIIALFIFLTCWCCPLCPLYQKMVDAHPYEIADEEELHFARKYHLLEANRAR